MRIVYFFIILSVASGCTTKQAPEAHLHQVTETTHAENILVLSESQIRLANVSTQSAGLTTIGNTVSINGRLATDQEKSEVISSRAAGRIEKLFVKETGIQIQKGQPLYTLYSELLLTLQQEYLLAKEQYEALGKTETRYKSFLDAAEKKLLLYGLTKDQVNQLKDRSSLQPRVTFVAPATGVATEILVSEGQYITEGNLLYKLENIDRLWIEAELYPGETSFLKVGDEISARINENDKDPISARVLFLSPEYRANSQITIMRASLENPARIYKPGQQVNVYLTHSSKQAIAIPVDAVIREGNESFVFIQAGHNTFKPLVVKTGLENFDQVEIIDGLKEADTVVVSGAYLLYSEIVFKKGRHHMAQH
jgi:Cu(I)/Ag(I) efflux system membrane fusion protein